MTVLGTGTSLWDSGLDSAAPPGRWNFKAIRELHPLEQEKRLASTEVSPGQGWSCGNCGSTGDKSLEREAGNANSFHLFSSAGPARGLSRGEQGRIPREGINTDDDHEEGGAGTSSHAQGPQGGKRSSPAPARCTGLVQDQLSHSYTTSCWNAWPGLRGDAADFPSKSDSFSVNPSRYKWLNPSDQLQILLSSSRSHLSPEFLPSIISDSLGSRDCSASCTDPGALLLGGHPDGDGWGWMQLGALRDPSLLPCPAQPCCSLPGEPRKAKPWH